MRSLKPAFLLLVAFVACCLGHQARAEPAAVRPVVKGLVVHEWGVFTVHDDVKLANADMRAEWNGLPKFVYGQIKGRELPKDASRFMPVAKPVLFFHCPREIDVDLKVDFPGGLPAVWWPGTQTPAGTRSRTAAGPTLSRTLEWRLHLKEAP